MSSSSSSEPSSPPALGAQVQTTPLPLLPNPSVMERMKSLLLLLLLSGWLAAAAADGTGQGSLNAQEYHHHGTDDCGWGEGVCPGSASFYGPSEGAGNLAGQCGYGTAVAKPPYSSLVMAVAPDSESYRHGGAGCGRCYKIKCNGHPACSPDGVTVTLADVCHGGPCLEELNHVQLSGKAFGAMAQPGREEELRAAGRVTVSKEWVDCVYASPPAFLVHPTATKDDFKLTILYVPGPCWKDNMYVLLREAAEPESWRGMTWWQDGIWKFTDGKDIPIPVSAPLSIRMFWRQMTNGTQMNFTAENVIPAGWKPGTTYPLSTI